MEDISAVTNLVPTPDLESTPDLDSLSFLDLYLTYTAHTEAPTFFHRWSAITSIAAWIGRDIYFPFGHGKVHCNMYTMLVGLAGTRKSTAIKIGAKLLKKAGYKDFAAKKTRQEKFLIDLSEAAERKVLDESIETDILDQNLFGEDLEEDPLDKYDSRPPAECFVAADEANNFLGIGNMEFMAILGELWDIDEVFTYKLKNSESVNIPYPTISLLGGNTFVGFNRLFPPEAIEQGFFSRMLFIHAEPVPRKYCVPPEPDADIEDMLVARLKEMKRKVKGKVSITKDAYTLLDTIYMKWVGMDDPRFDSYENRRIVHLLKIAMVVMSTNLTTTLTTEHILEASTILTYTEHLMPKALGEFGSARNSNVTHKIMEMINLSKGPVLLQTIWKAMHQDFESREQLMAVINNLLFAEKIQVIERMGYIPCNKVRTGGVKGAVDWSYLSKDELDSIEI